VVDSADKLRIQVARNELDILLDHPGISQQSLKKIHTAIKKREVPILFFANKMDMAMSMNESEVAKEMQLDQITDRPWHIQYSFSDWNNALYRASSATEGTGINEGINWLSEIIKRNKKW